MARVPFPLVPHLTAISLAWDDQKLISDEVLPRVEVGSIEFRWDAYDLGEAFKIPDAKVGRRGKPSELSWKITETAGFCEEFAFDDPVPQRDIDAAPKNRDPLGEAVERTTRLLALAREKRVADLVFATTSYPTDNRSTLSGSDQWSHADSKPIDLISQKLDLMVKRANVMVIGRQAWQKLSVHPDIVEAALGTGAKKGIVRREAVAELFELDKLLVGEAWVDTAKMGQTSTRARVWGKHCALLHIDPAAGMKGGPTFGFTAEFGSRMAGSWEDKMIGAAGGQRVRVKEDIKEVVASGDLGFFLQNVVA